MTPPYGASTARERHAGVGANQSSPAPRSPVQIALFDALQLLSELQKELRRT
jgi:hypothetical protein